MRAKRPARAVFLVTAMVLGSPIAFAQSWTDKQCKLRLTYADGFYALSTEGGSRVRCEAQTDNARIKLSCGGYDFQIEGTKATQEGVEMVLASAPPQCSGS